MKKGRECYIAKKKKKKLVYYNTRAVWGEDGLAVNMSGQHVCGVVRQGFDPGLQVFLCQQQGVHTSFISFPDVNQSLSRLHQLVVVVWYTVRKFVSPSRRFVCDSHTNSRAILIFQPPINNKPTSL
jgi:hypothetical protein